MFLLGTAAYYKRDDIALWYIFWGANPEVAKNLSPKLSSELKQGDSQEKIDKILRENGVGFSFNRFDNRYQGIIRNVSPGNPGQHAVVVHINVDENKRFLSAEVHDSFTAP
ncbi:MAG: hypothetical protein SGJ17_05320 [Hyphomicrobiales bacterium]|nr:hypothetical protein [Hyphomicrobiales bacterium]